MNESNRHFNARRPLHSTLTAVANHLEDAMRCAIAGLLLLLGGTALTAAEQLTPQCRFEPGPINGVLIQRGGQGLAIYGWQGKDNAGITQLLLPHARRDLVSQARTLSRTAATVAPQREQFLLSKPSEFWNAFPEARFHDYAQQSTKILPAAINVKKWVGGGDRIEWQGLDIRVLETPGFTRGSVSYLLELDGQRLAFTGDLIYGEGQLLDLYSFQDAIPEAKIRGYHGYGSRLAGLVESLSRLERENPDLIVPARGPVIREPKQAIARLRNRVQSLYKNYLSTNALHWYFKEDRMRTCGRRVLGPDAEIELMPYARHEKTPDWIFEHSTSRLLISKDGHGFLLDCGYQRVIDAVQELIKQQVIKQVDGIFVTHYHDDHTDMVQTAAEAFNCPVYATTEYADLLERPEAYHLPAQTSNPIKITTVKDGQQLSWREFTLTFHFFPGQTWYHGALLAKKPGEKPVFFIGDAFAPSGLDDYCVLNRNLVHSDSGYLLCLEKIRKLNEPAWLVNEHIQYVFEFSDQEMKYLTDRYQERIAILRELFPWDDPNYGVDEQWAFFYPHGSRIGRGKSVELEARIANHSPVERTFRVTPHTHGGLDLADDKPQSITLAPRATGIVKFRAEATGEPGNYLVTADITSQHMEFESWLEALVTVE